MILEFSGLPGSGKTTLEAAISRQLAVSGGSLRSRFELQQTLIQALIPHNRGGTLRRPSSLLYKSCLTVDALRQDAGILSLKDFSRSHLVRSAQRLVESQWLYSKLKIADLNWCSLGEGVTQNYCALRVWQRLLRPGVPSLTPALLEQHFDLHPHYLIKLNLSVESAGVRLLQRGRPKLWPSSVPTQEIVEAFDEELIGVEQLLVAGFSGVKPIEIDADIALSGWTEAAQRVIGHIL